MGAAAQDAAHAAGAAPRVLVTRPEPQASQWVEQLRALGQSAAALPLLEIAGPPDEDAVRQAWTALPGCALAMFVSPSAVERFFALAPARQAWPADTLAGGTGQGTRRALLRAGVPAAAVVSPPEAGGQFDSEALWAQLQGRRRWAGAQALIVRGEAGRDWFAETLRAAGACPHFVHAYRRQLPQFDAAQQSLLAAALAAPAAHCWLFSSSEAAGHLASLAPGADWSAAQALATHPRIAAAARALGFRQVGEVTPSPEAVSAALHRPGR